MRVVKAPEIGRWVPHRCPKCMGLAVVHAKVDRAIHDWATTFVGCARLRCCGRTFLSVPLGLTPRSRYSDRVIGLARSLYALGASLREIRKLLKTVGVPVTGQAIAAWCRGVPRQLRNQVSVTRTAEGQVAMLFRPGVWLSIRTRTPRRTEDLLEGYLGSPATPLRAVKKAGE